MGMATNMIATEVWERLISGGNDLVSGGNDLASSGNNLQVEGTIYKWWERLIDRQPRAFYSTHWNTNI